MEKVRFGVIGLGNQGSHYVLGLFDKGKIKDGWVSAMCDILPSRIEGIKARTSCAQAKYFTDYKEMLDSGLCDAVLVETPHYLHPEIVLECLKRGIHVLCDKPVGVYTAQVRPINEFAMNAKAIYGVMFNQRTNCLYRKMREIISSGEIGNLQRVTWIVTDWYRTQHYYDTGNWRATWAGEGGGVLINQCPHQLDLVQWVVGETPIGVNSFCKYGKWHDIEVEDEVTAYFEYKSGATGVFITTTGETPGTNRFEVSGTKGKLLCENEKLFWYKNDRDSRKFSFESQEAFGRPICEVIQPETDGDNPQHAGIINNFIGAILGKEELFVDGKEGIKGVELMNAIELSGWRKGERVTLPVNEEEYLTELGKRRERSRWKVGHDGAVTDTAGTFGGNGNVF